VNLECIYSETTMKRIVGELDRQEKGIVVIFTCLLIITFIACVACPHRLLAGFLLLFVCGPVMLWLGRAVISITGQFLTLRDMLLHVAFQECCCGRKDRCHVCQVRALLEREYPRAIEQKIHDHVLDGRPIPEEIEFPLGNPSGACKVGKVKASDLGRHIKI
jgi:hypothetical protein